MDNKNTQSEFKLKDIVNSSLTNSKESCYALVDEYIAGFTETLDLMVAETNNAIKEIPSIEESEEIKAQLLEIENAKFATFENVGAELGRLIKNLKNEQYKDYFVHQILYTSSLLQVSAQLILQIDIILNKPNLNAQSSIQPFLKEFATISKNDDIHTALMKEYYFSQINTGAFLENPTFISQYPLINYVEGEDEKISNTKTLMRIQFETLFNYFVKDLSGSYREGKQALLEQHNLL